MLRVSTSPIFTDESGRRAVTLQWAARGFCLCCALVAGAVVFTLTTHVPLPGLDRILSPRTGSDANRTITAGTDPAGDALVAGLRPAAPVHRVVTTAAASPRSTIAVEGVHAAAKKKASRVAVSVAQSRATGSPTPAPAATEETPAGSNPRAHSQNASSNPHAVAKGSNFLGRATAATTKTANPKAAAARTYPHASATPTATPVHAKN